MSASGRLTIAMALSIALTSACQAPFDGSGDKQPTARQADRELVRMAHTVIDVVAGADAEVWFNDDPDRPSLPCQRPKGSQRYGIRYLLFVDSHTPASDATVAAASSKLRELGFHVDPVDDTDNNPNTSNDNSSMGFRNDALDGQLTWGVDHPIVLTAQTKCLAGHAGEAPGDT